MQSELLKKYNVPAPRYTSYPTVPYWQKDAPSQAEWQKSVLEAFSEDDGISLYIHLPYCENLCTYCGCNKRITKQHSVEEPYIETVLKEWQLYVGLLVGRPRLRELHLGGGTPTFFSPANLHRLISGILKDVDLTEAYEFGFEAHPNSTSKGHLEVLADLGFRRLSIGIQDFDQDILQLINRHQTYKQVVEVTREARKLGYTSINYDLIFGLPRQSPEHIRQTMEKLQVLRPERIAFYSYAHVPWIKPSQRAYSEADLPKGEEKRQLYELGRELLEDLGYREIGMDHFALPEDELYQALETGSLHRSFMGYTPYNTRLNLALGASSISDSWDIYVQNEKSIEAYTDRVEQGEFPITKGHVLSREDQILRRHILNIMCRFETHWSCLGLQTSALEEGLRRLPELESDQLVELFEGRLKVTPAGLPFLRNICMALDARYWRKQPEGSLFSMAV